MLGLCSITSDPLNSVEQMDAFIIQRNLTTQNVLRKGPP